MENNDSKTEMTAVSLSDVPNAILQLINEHLVERANIMRENTRLERLKYKKEGIPHTTDIISPYCDINSTLGKNIDNLLACYSNTLSAALFSEHEYIKKLEELEALKSIVGDEKSLFFDFLIKNGLVEKFDEFEIKHKGVKFFTP